MTLGLLGFGGACDPHPADHGLDEAVDAWRCESLHRRSFEVWEVPPRRSRFNPSPGASLHPARSSRRCVRLLTKTVRPSDQWTRHSAYPRPAWRIPFSSPPRRVAVSRCPPRLVRPLNEPYPLRSEKTRDKDLKKHDDLDHQAHWLWLQDHVRRGHDDRVRAQSIFLSGTSRSAVSHSAPVQEPAPDRFPRLRQDHRAGAGRGTSWRSATGGLPDAGTSRAWSAGRLRGGRAGRQACHPRSRPVSLTCFGRSLWR